MFIIMSEYLKPADFIDTFLDAHRLFLDEYIRKGVILVAGRKVPRTGGVILAKGKTKEEVERFMREDPFSINRIARYEIVEFIPTKIAKGLESLLQD